jgi:argonaute-like protein implicated in RNA metabolism and viral defense
MDYHDIIDEEYDHETDIKIDFIQNELKNESWYVQRVVELKTNMSYGDISKLTKIPRSSLYGTFNQFRDKIIHNYKK